MILHGNTSPYEIQYALNEIKKKMGATHEISKNADGSAACIRPSLEEGSSEILRTHLSEVVSKST